MLFNSHIFIFVFLPITFIGYFLFARYTKSSVAVFWLILASLFFYSFWNPIYLPLILASLFGNFFFGKAISKSRNNKKLLTGIGVALNVALLAYFKYANFFVENVNTFLEESFTVPNIVLPLAISFFTFQQIAYLVDSYKGYTKEYSLLNYGLFVTFFPQLISGPIVHHSEMMPQFAKNSNKNIHLKNIAVGLFILSLGLFKKVGIADTFAIWANAGFDNGLVLTFVEAWTAALAYTFQLYFDFSGYTDMAIGIALLFNIALPINFNSPYKALNIQDFWRRWHITLSRFLRDYIYIPLGGSREGSIRTQVNFMAVFLIGGLWHGAAWTFVIWGALHGIAMVVHFLYRTYIKIAIPKIIAWLTTFAFIVFTWVVFRAETMTDTVSIWKSMLGLNGISLPTGLQSALSFIPQLQFNGFFSQTIDLMQTSPMKVIVGLAGTLLLVVALPNSIELKDKFKPNFKYLGATIVLFLSSMYMMSRVSEFIYFNF